MRAGETQNILKIVLSLERERNFQIPRVLRGQFVHDDDDHKVDDDDDDEVDDDDDDDEAW